MKKSLFTSLFALGILSTNAQTFVSTSVENKNVVLEEFTGIYCTFCPDGHKRAKQFADANPGNVVLINIHTGGYANPQNNDPDFRTSFGAAIANQSNLNGYPAGTVNRHDFSSNGWAQNGGTAMGRANWSNAGNAILAETSPVNVETQTTYDPSAGTLTIVAEVYYTGNSNADTNKLNIGIVQDNVEGPQTGMSANPDQVLPNGKYLHHHMLRDMVTGQWGVDVTTTSTGSFYTQTYTWNVPSNINDIPVNVADLRVVSFVAEGKQEILSGFEEKVQLPANMQADLSSATTTTATNSFCTNTITPELKITNNHSNTVTSFDVDVSVNGTATTQSYSGSLANGANTTISFGSIALSSGVNKISFSKPYNINGGSLIDIDHTNNSVPEIIATYIAQDGNDPDYSQGFESTDNGNIPTTMVAINPKNLRMYKVDNTINQSITQEIGGFGNSSSSLRWDYFSIPDGEVSSVITHDLDFSNVDSARIFFSHAYAQYASEDDELEVSFSKDCGDTWTSVFKKAGDDLKTRGPVGNNTRFYPQPNEWDSTSVHMPGAEGEAHVLIKFSGKSNYGNDLYVDDIRLDTFVVSGGSTAVNDIFNLDFVSVFPNPTSANATSVNVTLDKAATVSLKVIDLTGKTVIPAITKEMKSGENIVRLQLDNMNAGIYFISLNVDENTLMKKLIIE